MDIRGEDGGSRTGREVRESARLNGLWDARIWIGMEYGTDMD